MNWEILLIYGLGIITGVWLVITLYLLILLNAEVVP